MTYRQRVACDVPYPRDSRFATTSPLRRPCPPSPRVADPANPLLIADGSAAAIVLGGHELQLETWE